MKRVDFSSVAGQDFSLYRGTRFLQTVHTTVECSLVMVVQHEIEYETTAEL